MVFPHYAPMILGAMGIEESPERLAFLAAWAACEGGSAAFNPFNTTMKLAGSRDFNRAGVQHYRDPLQGVCATVLTLRLPFYDELRAALAKDHLSAMDITRLSVRSLNTWGTGSVCIEWTLRRRR